MHSPLARELKIAADLAEPFCALCGRQTREFRVVRRQLSRMLFAPGAGEAYALTEFNASAQLKALDQPFSSSGNGSLNGQAFDYRIRLDTIQALTAGEEVGLDARLGTLTMVLVELAGKYSDLVPQ